MKDGEVKNKLSPAQVSVMRHKVTEPPYFGKYWDHFEAGTYSCAACDTVLFGSADKFDSKNGWPTFKKPLNERNLEFKKDPTGETFEIRCKKCKSHLGYVIAGEAPVYRINSVCLTFEPEAIPAPVVPPPSAESEKGAQNDAPVRPEFPLPPPAIALIEDEGPEPWSMKSIAAGIVLGVFMGIIGMYFYAGEPSSTATSTPEIATTTAPASTQSPDETAPTPDEETTPAAEEASAPDSGATSTQ